MYHKRIAILPPDKRRFVSELRPVKVVLQDIVPADAGGGGHAQTPRGSALGSDAGVREDPGAQVSQRLVDLRGGVAVACGDCHTLAVAAPPEQDPLNFPGLDGGALFGWGCGWSGRLGRPDGDLRARLVSMPGGGMLTARSRLSATGSAAPSVRQVVTASQAAAGGRHSVIVTPDRRVFSAGSNDCGQLGRNIAAEPDAQVAGGGVGRAVFGESCNFAEVPLPAPGPPALEAEQVACGDAHCLLLARTADGTRVFAWGAGARGQLGLGDRKNRASPEAVAALDGRDVAHVACGATHSAAVSDRGVLYTWGCNDSGQCGPVAFDVTKQARERLAAKKVAEREQARARGRRACVHVQRACKRAHACYACEHA
jgi:hypothetical protein